MSINNSTRTSVKFTIISARSKSNSTIQMQKTKITDSKKVLEALAIVNKRKPKSHNLMIWLASSSSNVQIMLNQFSQWLNQVWICNISNHKICQLVSEEVNKSNSHHRLLEAVSISNLYLNCLKFSRNKISAMDWEWIRNRIRISLV